MSALDAVQDPSLLPPFLHALSSPLPPASFACALQQKSASSTRAQVCNLTFTLPLCSWPLLLQLLLHHICAGSLGSAHVPAPPPSPPLHQSSPAVPLFRLTTHSHHWRPQHHDPPSLSAWRRDSHCFVLCHDLTTSTIFFDDLQLLSERHDPRLSGPSRRKVSIVLFSLHTRAQSTHQVSPLLAPANSASAATAPPPPLLLLLLLRPGRPASAILQCPAVPRQACMTATTQGRAIPLPLPSYIPCCCFPPRQAACCPRSARARFLSLRPSRQPVEWVSTPVAPASHEYRRLPGT